MIYTNLKSSGAHRIGTHRADKSVSHRAVEYDAVHGPTHLSVYSAHCVVTLIRSHDICAGCHGEHDLINNYCDVCRACAANERQCVNSDLIGRSEQGRVNSQKSMWRTKRDKA